MHVECGVVSVDFVQDNFCIVVVRQQDFELQGSGFIFQATGFVRHLAKVRADPSVLVRFQLFRRSQILTCPLSLAAAVFADRRLLPV